VKPEIYAALQSSFRALGIRLHPNANVTSLYSALVSAGIELTADGALLSATQNGQPINIATSLRALVSKPETRANFVQEGAGVQHLSDLDKQGRSDYIRDHGFDAFQKLVADSRSPKLRSDVELGPDAKAKDVKQWTRDEKTQFINQWGFPAYQRCVGRV
jgi:hypothetical protein